uniref:Uncharacterized protein n=1 Tax=Populus alba TaxID=43335 RepID=A0A4U5PNR2_POPAL|nr:hypothetical protein D5086_0000198350 [Populus alba]
MGNLQVHTRQFQSYNGNRNRSKGRFPQGSRFFGPKPGFSSMAPVLPNSNSGVLGQSPAQPFRHPSALMVPICQLCNSEGHTAPFCRASPPKRTRCNICGRSNHTSWYCFYNDKGPNYMASYSPQSSFSMQPNLCSILHIRLPLHRAGKSNNPQCKLCSNILHIRLHLHRTGKSSNLQCKLCTQ